MSQYIATFHTHLAALRTGRTMEGRRISVQMRPVPRELSSACGTCVCYESNYDCMDLLDSDVEALYLIEGGYVELAHWD
ncbi:DUF3343 domain-containing protein [Bengtsoniella intestinalis]|uniref:DUF3343 domain-containing protein n=1 Tax=Bengtsoniella intestinalis TaxID=3073143 RepID=UPI00391F25BD